MDLNEPVSSSSALGILFIFPLLLGVIVLIAMWRIYTKAGKPGWSALIPLYNIYVLQEIVGRPGWWTLLYFVPFVNMIISLLNALDLAKVFGKTSLFGVIALWIVAPIGYIMLGFGKDQYSGQSIPTTPMATVPPQAGEVTPVNKPPVVPAPLIQDITPSVPTPVAPSEPKPGV